ncbi:RT0821/Lpp0805 family surface protein [Hyphobacterium sp.]|uniref:RT0821/Lpp0805 family surface protein n=1 Tax=Hyphobacterium sp. TaxID=2004662 RepID=UPI003BAAF096
MPKPCFLIALVAPLGVMAMAPAEAQSRHSTSFSYHSSYYEGGYDRYSYRYHRTACETRRSGGLGLGAVIGSTPILSVDVQLGGRFNDCDHRQYAYASGWSAEYRETAYWENPNTGARGAVHPRDYYRSSGRACASFESESWSGYGDYDRGTFDMCRNANGEWEFAGSYERRR